MKKTWAFLPEAIRCLWNPWNQYFFTDVCKWTTETCPQQMKTLVGNAHQSLSGPGTLSWMCIDFFFCASSKLTQIQSWKLGRRKCRLGGKYLDYTMVEETFVHSYNDCRWCWAAKPRMFLKQGNIWTSTWVCSREGRSLWRLFNFSPGRESCPRMLDIITRNYKYFVFWVTYYVPWKQGNAHVLCPRHCRAGCFIEVLRCFLSVIYNRTYSHKYWKTLKIHRQSSA